MIRIGILGATGYTALELMQILLRHPEVEITALTSRQEGEVHVTDVHPRLAGRLDLRFEGLDSDKLADQTDCIFSCLPHGASSQSIMPLLDAGLKVVDLSADYRLNDPQTYADWYGLEHRDPKRLASTVYGLPELFREQISKASLVANPGCYPTSAILALAPLLKTQRIEPTGIIVDSKSGVSGAGRSPKLATLYAECNESIAAYAVGTHRHTPEIEQILTVAAGSTVDVIFTPHLTPMTRGILTTAYSTPIDKVDQETLLEEMRAFYRDEPFVQVVDHLPATKDVAGTNFVHITVRCVKDKIISISCIDNLIKGASGAAVQNFNLMYGFEESTALG